MNNHSAGDGASTSSATTAPRIRDLVIYFLRLGTLGFGGPVALCGLMEKELVQDRGWLTKQEMRDAIVFQAELAVLFVGAGIMGILYYGSLRGRRKAPSASGVVTLIPVGAVAAKPATTSTLGQLFTFFL